MKVFPIFEHPLVVMLLVVHLLLGFRRLRERDCYRDDPLVLRIMGLQKIPDVSTISRTLSSMASNGFDNVRNLSRHLVIEGLQGERFARLSLDFDGSVQSTKGKSPCPKARASQMFDVLNKVSLDAIISPKKEGENELAAFHFLKLQPGDPILLDRGYHLRWPVEEKYKTVKYRLQVDNFSGKTVRSVYQDFHAKFFSKNFTAIIAATTKKDIVQKSRPLKFFHQLNFAQALSKMKDAIVLFFNRSGKEVMLLVEKIRKLFIQTTESVRPNRKYPRRHRVKKYRFFNEYKTFC